MSAQQQYMSVSDVITYSETSASEHLSWWCGIAVTRWSCCTLGQVSTWMGDCLRAGKPS